jgi:hypothetical protein
MWTCTSESNGLESNIIGVFEGKKSGTLTNALSIPTPKNEVPKIGKIHASCFSAVQPYQNRATGMNHAPAIIGGRRYSGLATPPFFSVRCLSSLSDVAPRMNNPIRDPIPIPRYASPTLPWEKPYWFSKTLVMVVKRRYRYP